jgi:hypothetical protein
MCFEALNDGCLQGFEISRMRSGGGGFVGENNLGMKRGAGWSYKDEDVNVMKLMTRVNLRRVGM